jgi:hypothetical protein
MSTFDPTPRQALRKAADADVHPTLPAPAAQSHEDLSTRAGSSASDTMRPPAKDKLVEPSVEIPKSLRKELRKKAEEQGMTLDALVTLYLRNRGN